MHPAHPIRSVVFRGRRPANHLQAANLPDHLQAANLLTYLKAANLLTYVTFPTSTLYQLTMAARTKGRGYLTFGHIHNQIPYPNNH